MAVANFVVITNVGGARLLEQPISTNSVPRAFFPRVAIGCRLLGGVLIFGYMRWLWYSVNRRYGIWYFVQICGPYTAASTARTKWCNFTVILTLTVLFVPTHRYNTNLPQHFQSLIPKQIGTELRSTWIEPCTGWSKKADTSCNNRVSAFLEHPVHSVWIESSCDANTENRIKFPAVDSSLFGDWVSLDVNKYGGGVEEASCSGVHQCCFGNFLQSPPCIIVKLEKSGWHDIDVFRFLILRSQPWTWT